MKSPPRSCRAMISIRIRELTKRFGAVTALDCLTLTIEPGELFFLLGPSGCGKTTLLRSLAGFYMPDEGTIHFGDEDVTTLPPHKRNTGMMFQSYALWPHMSVFENVAFGLEERKIGKAEIRQRVGDALAAVQMTEYGSRRPNELSGGQQQRVALARALVIRPRCLLLDEPLSNLDAKLRLEMRSEIRRVSKEYNLTTVYVTHDQKEALSVADRMAILDRGKVLQIGTPQEIYRRPRTVRVASFIGETDLIPGKLRHAADGWGEVETSLGVFKGALSDPTRAFAPNADVTVCVRPECWVLRTAPEGNAVQGRIGTASYLGEVAQYSFMAGNQTLKVLELNPRFEGSGRTGDIYATVRPDDVVILTA